MATGEVVEELLEAVAVVVVVVVVVVVAFYLFFLIQFASAHKKHVLPSWLPQVLGPSFSSRLHTTFVSNSGWPWNMDLVGI